MRRWLRRLLGLDDLEARVAELEHELEQINSDLINCCDDLRDHLDNHPEAVIQSLRIPSIGGSE